MKTILCYGDSNTYGTAPMTSLSTAQRFGYHERWTGVLRSETGRGLSHHRRRASRQNDGAR